MHQAHHRAHGGGPHRERLDRGPGRHIDHSRFDGETGIAQGLGRAVGGVLPQIGDEHAPACRDAAGYGLADGTGADQNNDFFHGRTFQRAPVRTSTDLTAGEL
jgi:hypothetical protein